MWKSDFYMTQVMRKSDFRMTHVEIWFLFTSANDDFKNVWKFVNDRRLYQLIQEYLFVLFDREA